jgi:hypothetical protein
MERSHIFLSHAGEDAQQARCLSSLLSNAGLEVWLDVERLTPGDRWMEELESALSAAHFVVLYVGRSGIRNWVDREVRVALDRSVRDPAFRLIPVLGPGSNPESLGPFLKQYQWVDLREGLEDPARIKRLLEGISGRPAENVSLLPPDKAPFLGLLAFQEEDSLLFYGRDRETAELLEKMRGGPFLTVVGDSGSGKSSLVRAGLIPALRRGRFHDGNAWVGSWRVAITRPGNDPFGELAESLPDLKPEMPDDDNKARFIKGAREELGEGFEGLRSRIAALVPRGTRTLLVVDQFEELFTGTDKLEKRRLFVDSLLAVARTETERPVHVVITLRADFYSRCWEHPELVNRMNACLYNVRRVGSEQLREVIEKPLALAGAEAQDGLVDDLLDDVGEEPGNLPLLEHALLQLWERRRDRTLTHDAYRKIGRLSGALKNHAEQVYNSLDAQGQAQARRIFLTLTQLGDASEDTRRRVRSSDLPGADSRLKDPTEVLVRLSKARLITGGGDVAAEGKPEDEWVEVSHEALIRGWPRLRGWLEESRDAIRFERRLIRAAEEWDGLSPKRHPDRLLQGYLLEEALQWSRNNPVPPLVREFITAAMAEVLYVDPETSLMWTVRDNGQDISWEKAVDYAKDLRLGGFTDWRLPTIDELEKLSDPVRGDEYFNIRQPFRLTTWWVWSSMRVEGSGSALIFDFRDGESLSDIVVNSFARALCVRRSGD